MSKFISKPPRRIALVIELDDGSVRTLISEGTIRQASVELKPVYGKPEGRYDIRLIEDVIGYDVNFAARIIEPTEPGSILTQYSKKPWPWEDPA